MSTKSEHSTYLILFAYFVIYVVWGSTYFFIHKALEGFSPFVLGSLRFIAASIILMTYCKMKGYKLWNKRIIKQTAFIGFLLLFVDMAAIIWVEQFIASGIVAIMAAAAAIWFIIFDKPKWKQNFSSLPTVVGLILGFIGVILLFAEQIMVTSDTSSKSLKIIGMIVLIIGSIAWTLGSLYSKYVVEKEENQGEDLHIMVKTAWQMITAGLAFNFVALFNGEYSRFDITAVTIENWGALIYLITFGSILAFSCYLWLIQIRPATEVSTYAYVNPIVAVALSYFFTDDVITELQITGLFVVLFSVLLMNWNLYRDSKYIRKLFKPKHSKKRLSNIH